jgi:outer membrane receptor protein involved in Fe transport
VRLVLSKGSRSPDIQEQRADWTYTFSDVSPPLNGSSVARFYQSRVGPGNLVSERIQSVEAGYLLNDQRRGLLVDFKVFRDQLTCLISERTNLAGAPPTNDGRVSLRGAEVQASLALSPRTSAVPELRVPGQPRRQQAPGAQPVLQAQRVRGRRARVRRRLACRGGVLRGVRQRAGRVIVRATLT